MLLTVHLPTGRRRAARPAPARRGRRPGDSGDVPKAPARRRALAPQDTAFYTCGCGCAWTAAVTTSVGCPRCGTPQAW